MLTKLFRTWEDNEPGATPSGATPPANEPKPEPTPGEPPATQGKTFTEVEFNAHMAAARRKFEAEAKKAAEEAAAKAKMDETERAKVEREEALKKAQEFEQRAIRAERRAALAGQVSSPERVLTLIGAETEKYFSDDGKANLEAIWADFPEYKPQTTPSQPPAAGYNGRQGADPSKLSDAEFFRSKLKK